MESCACTVEQTIISGACIYHLFILACVCVCLLPLQSARVHCHVGFIVTLWVDSSPSSSGCLAEQKPNHEQLYHICTFARTGRRMWCSLLNTWIFTWNCCHFEEVFSSKRFKNVSVDICSLYMSKSFTIQSTEHLTLDKIAVIAACSCNCWIYVTIRANLRN